MFFLRIGCEVVVVVGWVEEEEEEVASVDDKALSIDLIANIELAKEPPQICELFPKHLKLHSFSPNCPYFP